MTPTVVRAVAAGGRLLLLGLVLGWLPGLPPAAAQPSQPAQAELEVRVHTFRHQPASEALALIQPLLSPRGSVQLQQAGNTLVVRDTRPVLELVGRLLAEFDHPPRLLAVRIQVVLAGAGEDADDRLDPELERRLAELLRFDSYRLLSDAAFEAREGEQVSYQLGDEYRVAFKLGTLMAGERIKLRGFEVSRRAEGEQGGPLLRTHLNLSLGRPLTLGLANDESSRRALLLVLTCTLGAGAAP